MSLSLRIPGGRAIAALVVVFAAGGGSWWLVSSRSDDAVKVPEKICNHRVSGDKATPLLPAEGAKFEDEAIQFRTPQSSGSCRLKRGDAEVYITYLAGQGNYPRERIQSKGIPASLGDAYGYLSDKGGISLYVPCGPSFAGDDQNRLIVGTSASVVRETVKSSGAPGKSTKGLRPLSAFAAQAARDIAQDWFKCPGADRLPDGPVNVHWGK